MKPVRKLLAEMEMEEFDRLPKPLQEAIAFADNPPTLLVVNRQGEVFSRVDSLISFVRRQPNAFYSEVVAQRKTQPITAKPGGHGKRRGLGRK